MREMVIRTWSTSCPGGHGSIRRDNTLYVWIVGKSHPVIEENKNLGSAKWALGHGFTLEQAQEAVANALGVNPASLSWTESIEEPGHDNAVDSFIAF